MLPEEVLAQGTRPGTHHDPEARKKTCPILLPCLGQRGWCSCCWPRHGQGVRRVPSHGQGVRRVPRPAGASRVQGDLRNTEWVHALPAPGMEASWAPLHLPRPAGSWEGEHGPPHPDGSSSAGRGQCPCSHRTLPHTVMPAGGTPCSRQVDSISGCQHLWESRLRLQHRAGCEGLPGHPAHLSSQGKEHLGVLQVPSITQVPAPSPWTWR